MEYKIAVIIPALNEEKAIGKVLADIPAKLVEEVIVIDNGSEDGTVEKARSGGATVLEESKKGYGHACIKGITYLIHKIDHPQIVVFLDADYSDYPEELVVVASPIWEDDFDLVIGSRALGVKEQGSMTFLQVFGNWLATGLIQLFFKTCYSDLGPFRAVKFDRLTTLDMRELTYGWTVEMQLKAAKFGWRITEVPVSYRKRIGRSKVSGTVKGAILAGYRILWTIFKSI